MVLAAALGVILVATLMLGGWGWAFRRVFRLEPAPWASTVALGMAVVVFLGGFLNLARLAYPPALAILAAAGVLLAVFWLRETILERPPFIVSLIVGAILVFTIWTQLPPGIYNFHDDFQKYFAYPVRMLETGTVFGSPLSAIGIQTLGAQAVLDGFVAAFFPLAYLNGVDAVFGLFLCLILASQFSAGGALAMRAICVLSVVVINPQYVNISTLYCGSALIMAAMGEISCAVSVGLLYAALIAMKPTFIVFVAIHLAAIALVKGIGWIVRASVAAAAFLSPWILLHAPSYVAGLRAHLPAPTPVAGPIEVDRANLFSFASLDYGSAPIHYTALMAAIAICGWICWRAPQAQILVAHCAAAIATFFVFVYFLGPIHAGFEQALRYYAPIAIGIAPPIFAWTARLSRRLWIPLIVAAAPLAGFAPAFETRLDWAVKSHSIAAYAWLALDADYRSYNQTVLSESQRISVRSLQALIPAGEPILAWMDTPFYLDYSRNRIFDIEPAGIGAPWARIPEAQYLIWEYKGYATPQKDDYEEEALVAGAGERLNAQRTLDFVRQLEKLAGEGETLSDDGAIKVVRFRQARAQPPIGRPARLLL